MSDKAREKLNIVGLCPSNPDSSLAMEGPAGEIRKLGELILRKQVEQLELELPTPNLALFKPYAGFFNFITLVKEEGETRVEIVLKDQTLFIKGSLGFLEILGQIIIGLADALPPAPGRRVRNHKHIEYFEEYEGLPSMTYLASSSQSLVITVTAY